MPPHDGHGGKDAGRYYSATMPNNNDLAASEPWPERHQPSAGQEESGEKRSLNGEVGSLKKMHTY